MASGIKKEVFKWTAREEKTRLFENETVFFFFLQEISVAVVNG